MGYGCDLRRKAKERSTLLATSTSKRLLMNTQPKKRITPAYAISQNLFQSIDESKGWIGRSDREKQVMANVGIGYGAHSP